MRESKRISSILVLTSADQQGTGIGTLYLNALTAGAPEIDFHWQTEQPFLLGNNLARFGKLGALVRSLLVRLPLWSALRLALFKGLFMQCRIKRIDHLLQLNKISTILLTTSSPELIAIGAQLTARGHDVLPIVWDVPEYLAKNLRLDYWSERNLKSNFNALMCGTRAAGVISEAMRDLYNNDYGIHCEIIRHGTAAHCRLPNVAEMEEIKIVFAGSLYSKQEWNAFVEALDIAKWKIDGRVVRLFFIGDFPLAGAVRPKQMEHILPVPHAMAIQLMGEMDIGYLPYWFALEHKVVTSTSFPGKMTAYAAAGLAIFHHGPSYSTVTQFLERYPFGLSCHSLDPAAILKKIEQLFHVARTPDFEEARANAMRRELSDKAMIDASRRLLSLRHRDFQNSNIGCVTARI